MGPLYVDQHVMADLYGKYLCRCFSIYQSHGSCWMCVSKQGVQLAWRLEISHCLFFLLIFGLDVSKTSTKRVLSDAEYSQKF